MPRYGCRVCGKALPKVSAAQAMRVQCANPACGAMNVVPADPPAAARDAQTIGVTEEAAPAMIARVRRRRVPWIVQALLGLLVAAGVALLIPPVRNAAYERYQAYRARHANPPRPADEQPTGPTEAQKQEARTLAVGIKPDIGVPKLIEYLRHEDAGVRSAAAKALAKLGPDAKDAVPALTVEVSHDYSTARADAANALAAIGPDAKSAVPQLIIMSQDFVRKDRDAAVNALEKIAPDDPQAQDAVAKARERK